MPWRRSLALAGALALALVAACARPPAPIYDRSSSPYQRAATTTTRIQRPSQVVVQRGDTLYSLAWRYGLDYRTLGRWNGIGPPYTIFVGDTIVLEAPRQLPAERRQPAATTVALPASAPGVAAAEEPEAPATGERTPSPGERAAPPPDPVPRVEPVRAEAPRWRWPAEGEIVGRFSTAAAARKGIDIGGELGDPVRAAASGQVVYSGSGLVGYGELIIIKHDEAFLSAYAHNRRRLVEEGQAVKQGQTIAEMGQTAAERPMLHFEIRENGQPRDPLEFLPPR